MRQPASTALLVLSLVSPPVALAQDATDAHLKQLIGRKTAKLKAVPAAQLGNPKEESAPEPAAALTASPAPAPTSSNAQSEADLALLRAILFAFEPAPREIRVLAIEDLALLQDPRALNPLSHFVFDPDPIIALAAVKAIGHFQHPRAEEIIGNIIRHPSLSPTLKVAAVRALPFQDSPSSREFLTELSGSNAYGSSVKQAAQAAIAEMVSIPAPPPNATVPARGTAPPPGSSR